MKRMGLPVFTFAIVFAVILSIPVSAHAQDAAATLQIKMCHVPWR